MKKAIRIIAIFYTLFISLFSLDVFSLKLSFWTLLSALFIHLIPTFLLLIPLFFITKKPKLSAYLYLSFGLIFTFFFRTYQHLVTFLLLTLPFLLLSALLFTSLSKTKPSS